MTETRFCYIPIEKSSRTIRLLYLLPELHPSDNRIQCRLENHSLDLNSHYEALSYTWGQPDEYNFRIWVNGVHFIVRQNLMCALRVLRGDSERTLWIDAICINQDDDAERGHQVQMMGDIYRGAWRVLSWLGTPIIEELSADSLDTAIDMPPDKAVLAFDFLEICEDLGVQGRAALKLPDDNLILVDMESFNRIELDNHWQDLARICTSDYWSRAWIIQEVCLAVEIVVLYGKHCLSWNRFNSFRHIMIRIMKIRFAKEFSFAHSIKLRFQEVLFGERLSDYPTDFHHTFRAISESIPWQLQDMLMSCPSVISDTVKKPPEIKDLIPLSIGSLCAEPRDKLFSLLGLACDSAFFAVDYSQDLYGLYATLIEDSVLRNNSLETLQLSSNFQMSLLRSTTARRSDPDSVYYQLAMGRRNATALRSYGRFMYTPGQICGKISHIWDSKDWKGKEDEEVWDRVWQHLFEAEDADKILGNFRMTAAELWQEMLQGLFETDKLNLSFFEYDEAKKPQEVDDEDRYGRYTETDRGYVVFRTSGGHRGVCPGGTKPKDLLWTIDMPYRPEGERIYCILRRHSSGYRVLGKARVMFDSVDPLDQPHMVMKKVLEPLTADFKKQYRKSRIAATLKLSSLSVRIDIPMLQIMTFPWVHRGGSLFTTKPKKLLWEGSLV